MISVHSNIFWHQSANLRESTWTKEHKSNTLIQLLIALTVVIKILQF
jgi:hypothetical protein